MWNTQYILLDCIDEDDETIVGGALDWLKDVAHSYAEFSCEPDDCEIIREPNAIADKLEELKVLKEREQMWFAERAHQTELHASILGLVRSGGVREYYTSELIKRFVLGEYYPESCFYYASLFDSRISDLLINSVRDGACNHPVLISVEVHY